MKRILLMIEGAADVPQPAWGDKTPLQRARCDHLAALSEQAEHGVVDLNPGDYSLPADILMAWTGCDFHPGWSAFEARQQDLQDSDGAFLCGECLVCDEDRLHHTEASVLTMEETRALAADLENKAWCELGVCVHAVRPGGLLLAGLPGSVEGWQAAPPLWKEGDAWPVSPPPEIIDQLQRRAAAFLQDHPVNQVKVDLGESPASRIHLWGGANTTRPASPANRSHALVASSPGIVGAGLAAGMQVHSLSLQWFLPRDDRAVVPLPHIVQALQTSDDLVIYVEAPDGWGRYRGPENKIKALEYLDHYLFRHLMTLLQAHRPFRLAVLSDALALRRAGADEWNVPCMLLGNQCRPDHAGAWNEEAAKRGRLGRIGMQELQNRMTQED